MIATMWVWLAIVVAACGGSSVPPPDGSVEEPLLPQVPTAGGPVIAHPQLVSITWASDFVLAPDLEAFDRWVLQSSFWAPLVEYGIGAGSVVATWHVPTDPPAMMTELDVQNFLQTAITNASVPAPTPNTIYSMYFPPNVTITGSEGTSCVSYGGFHDAMTLPGGQRVYFVVNARCPTSTNLLDEMTNIASHEYGEASTDPDPVMPAYRLNAPDSLAPWLSGEIGDLCEDNDSVVDGYVINPLYINSAAAANQRPCVPAPPGPVFAALPNPDLLNLAIGMSGQTDVHIATVGASSGPLTLSVYPNDTTGALTVSATAPTVHPGDHVSVTIMLSSGMIGYGQNITLDLRDSAGYVSKRTLVVIPQ